MHNMKIHCYKILNVLIAANPSEKGSLDIVEGTFHTHPDMKNYIQNSTNKIGSNNDPNPYS